MHRQRAKQLKEDVIFEDEELPDEVAYFHRLFFEVWDSYRGLTYQNLYYWQQLYKIELSYDVIEMFKRVSGKANEFIRNKNKTEKPKK